MAQGLQRRGGGAQRGAQATDVQIDSPHAAAVVVAPDSVQQLFAALWTARLPKQVAQQGELLRSELDGDIRSAHRVRGEVQDERAAAQLGRGGCARPRQTLDTALQLAGVEAADNEVIAAERGDGVQPLCVDNQQPRHTPEDGMLGEDSGEAIAGPQGRRLEHHQIGRQGNRAIEVAAS